MQNVEKISESTPLFGGYAREFGTAVEAVLKRSAGFEHYFTTEDTFGVILADQESMAEANRIIALEMLQNSHLAALLCLLRSKQWLLACWSSYRRGDLLAWCNDLRLICPLLSGPISILELATKEEWNGKEAQA